MSCCKFPRAGERLVQLVDDFRYPFRCFRRKVPVRPELLGNHLSSCSWPRVKLKKMLDISPTPLHQFLELLKVRNMAFLDPSQGVEGYFDIVCCLTKA